MKDISQDWYIIHGEENDNVTVLKFGRRVDTCDTDDMPIGVLLIYYSDYWHYYVKGFINSYFVVTKCLNRIIILKKNVLLNPIFVILQ